MNFKILYSIPPIVIIIVILIILIKYLQNKEKKVDNEDKKENFKSEQNKPVRYMYNTSGIKRNSSYDVRGEEQKMIYEPEKTGNFYHGDLKNNFTNDRV